MVQNRRITNTRWRRPPSWKIHKRVYLGQFLINLHQIWCAYRYGQYKCLKGSKCHFFENLSQSVSKQNDSIELSISQSSADIIHKPTTDVASQDMLFHWMEIRNSYVCQTGNIIYFIIFFITTCFNMEHVNNNRVCDVRLSRSDAKPALVY